MTLKQAIGYKAREEMKKSMNLRKVSLDFKMSMDKSNEVREQQDEAFKKSQFFKSLNRAIDRVQND